jgi:thiamine-monophosphate kinase
MNEFELIAKLTKALPANENVVVGAGDDCAVLDLGVPEKLVLFKTDAVVEGIHFTRETPPEKIGRKALARCLSDIAAMAGTPTAALVTIALPNNFDADFVAKIYDGLNALAEKFGAKVGDAIFVTGELGGALAEKHLSFGPRLAEARWLAEKFSLHAMLDVSDGLGGDLRHILNASKVGAEILKSAVPVSRAAKLAARKSSTAKPAFVAALTDGEDFELLFTIASKDAVKLLDTWKKKFPELRLSCIGKIVAGDGILIRDKSGSHKFNAHGYVHFA